MNKKIETLIKMAKLLNDNDILWALGASTMLYFNNIVDEFNDIDIMIKEEDFLKAKDLLEKNFIINTPKVNENYKTKHFLNCEFNKVEFDIISGFVIVNDNKEYYFPLLKEDIVKEVILNDTKIYLHSLEKWLIFYRLMNREEKVKIIEDYLNK